MMTSRIQKVKTWFRKKKMHVKATYKGMNGLMDEAYQDPYAFVRRYIGGDRK